MTDDIADLKRRTVTGSAIVFAAQGVRFLIKIATQILIARLLTPSDYGLVAMVTPIMALSALLGDLGLGQTAVIKHDITTAETSALLWFGLILNCLVAAGLMALSPLIAMLYHEPRVLPITLILAALLPVTGLSVQHVALLNREMRFSRLAVFDIVSPAMALAVGLAAARSGWGYWSLIAAVVSETFTTCALAWSLSRWRPDRFCRHFPIWTLLGIGGHLTTTNLALYITATIDNVLLGIFQDTIELGLYNRGYRLITQSVEQLIAPTSRITVPLLNRLKNDPARYKKTWSRILQLMTLAGTPGILWVMLVAKPLVHLILGPQWVDVAPVFFWLGVGALAAPLNIATCWLFVTQEQTKRQARYVLIASAIAVAAFVTGLPWGAVGVSACAAVAFAAVSVPMYCWASTRYSIVKLIDIFTTMLPMVLPTGVTAILLTFVRDMVHPTSAVKLLEMLVLAYGSFAAFLLPYYRIWKK